MKKIKFSKRHIGFYSLFISLCILGIFKFFNNRYFEHDSIRDRVNHIYQEQVEYQNSLYPIIRDELIPAIKVKNQTVISKSEWIDIYDKFNTAFFIFSKDSLIFWNTTKVPVGIQYVYNTYNKPIVFKKRAIYTSSTHNQDDYKIVILTEIQKNVAMPSELARFEFVWDEMIPEEVVLVNENFESEYGEIYSINSKIGTEVAKVYMPYEVTKRNRKWENFLLGLVGYSFLMIGFAYRTHFKTPKSQGLFILLIVALSGLYLYLEATINLSGKNYGVGLFDSSLYASGIIFPSLGDYFNWALVFLLWAILLFLYVFQFVGRQNVPYFTKSKWVYGLMGVIEIIAIIPVYIIPQDLILNSAINLDFNFVTSFNQNSLAGVSIILFAMMAFMTVVISTTYFVSRNHSDFTIFNISRVVGLIIALIIIKPPILHILFWVLFATGVTYYLRIYYSKRLRALPDFFMILYSVLTSMYVGFLMVETLIEKRRTEVEFYADKVMTQTDPAARYFFIESSKAFQNDSTMKTMLALSKGLDNDILNLAINQHFTSYWANYTIKGFYKTGSVSEEDAELFNFFETQLASSIGFESANFTSVTIDTNHWKFIGKIDLPRIESNVLISDAIYLVFESKKYLGQTGLPEFLIKRPYYLEILQKGYQTGRYVNGKLVDKSGFTSMPSYISEENLKALQNEYKSKFYFKSNGNEAVLIVDITDDTLSYINTICILFLITMMVVGIFRVFANLILNPKRSGVSLASTFRLFILISLTTSFLLILANSITYTRDVYDNFDKKQIDKTGDDIKSDLENWMMARKLLKNREIDSELIKSLSSTYKVELNFYDAGGVLKYTTRPEIFTEQFRNSLLDPKAFKMLRNGQNSGYFVQDKIGDISFVSAYIPIYGPDNIITSYIEIPYFSEYAKKEAEISFSTNRIVRYFTIFLTLVLFIVLFASNRIVRPLEELRSKIISLRLGKRFEPIEYKGKDEIAALVKAYNIAIADLEVSAELLAKSEREKAWREMAKQVAHEIKNPLTPLKLNVQMLERAYLDGRDDFDIRLRQFTKSALEQIDTMAQIASDFSNFAKLDKVNNEQLHMEPLIRSVVAVFNSYMSNITIKAYFPEDSVIIYGDKDLVIRIFNNLIKNACQAIGEDAHGLVEVIVSKEGKFWKFVISDNGPGISEELKQSIFKPNFTTKSTGSGIGLAMCKSMVETMHGEISFTSNENEGTQFIILLNAI